MIFQYINLCPVPREMLKTSAYGLGFQHLPRDLANVNAWKTMFDPYNMTFIIDIVFSIISTCVRLVLPTSDPCVPGSQPSGGKCLSDPKRIFVAECINMPQAAIVVYNQHISF